MDHHPSRPGAPLAAARRWLPPSVAAIAVATILAGCGSSDRLPVDAAPGDGDPVAGIDGDPVAGVDDGGEANPDGTSTSTGLGDPTDAGFEPVVDAEIDPEANDPAGVDLTADDPDEVVARVAAEMAETTGGDGLLDTVAAIDAGRPTRTDDGRPRNELGELVSLDEAASLACGLVEIAVGDLDAGEVGDAGEGVRAAAGHAGRSDVADIRDWAGPLDEAAASPLEEPASLIGFLSVCTEGGYEL